MPILNFLKSKRKAVLAFLATFLSLFAVLIASNYVNQTKEIATSSKASGDVSLFFEPSEIAVNKNTDLTFTLKVDPKTENVTGVELHLTFDKDKITLQSIDKSTSFSTELVPTSIDANAGTASITLGVPVGGAVSVVTNVASIKVKTKDVAGSAVLKVDQSTIVTAAGKDASVLGSFGQTTITVNGTVSPTDNPTATPTLTPTPTSAPGAPNGCNGTCGSNNNCQANYMCYKGYCRLPACVNASNCNCTTATATPKVTAKPTATPTSIPVVVNPVVTPDNSLKGGVYDQAEEVTEPEVVATAAPESTGNFFTDNILTIVLVAAGITGLVVIFVVVKLLTKKGDEPPTPQQFQTPPPTPIIPITPMNPPQNFPQSFPSSSNEPPAPPPTVPQNPV